MSAISKDQLTLVQRTCYEMRKDILNMAYDCGTNAHLGGGLSTVEILGTLYGTVLRYDAKDPNWKERDRFILSKGHGVLGLYSALAEAHMFDKALLSTFLQNGSDLIAHPVMNLSLGIESSNGSLGQGLSMGVGIALAAKKKRLNYRVFVLVGNGECNEGAIWEAAMLAVQLKLDNLMVFVDNNTLQSDGKSEDILDMGDLTAKWTSFGFNAVSLDGHNIEQIYDALTSPAEESPKVIIANTVKGKGVSFAENNNAWHHNRLTKSQYEQAMEELEGTYHG